MYDYIGNGDVLEWMTDNIIYTSIRRKLFDDVGKFRFRFLTFKISACFMMCEASDIFK